MTALSHRFALLAALAALPAIAAEDGPIPPEEWRRLALGKIVHYALDGRHYGREYFRPDGETAVFKTPGGRCLEGPWAYADGRYCFLYGELHCFAHIRRDGDLYAVPDEGGPEQRIEKIVEGPPLSCAPEAISRAPGPATR